MLEQTKNLFMADKPSRVWIGRSQHDVNIKLLTVLQKLQPSDVSSDKKNISWKNLRDS